MTAEIWECCRYGELEELKELVEPLEDKRTMLLSKNTTGQTPIHMASANGHVEILEYLGTFLLPGDVNVQNEEGNTPLHWAALNGHASCVKKLLELGGSAVIKNGTGKSSITIAMEREHEEAFKLLAESYDPDEEDNDE
ncbi:ankyrin repeat-containing domain protein [Gorgonomyces haynaldii]|nr:ankyrin repeat-containing domain protein [Gorgonomyces haynaldii]